MQAPVLKGCTAVATTNVSLVLAPPSPKHPSPGFHTPRNLQCNSLVPHSIPVTASRTHRKLGIVEEAPRSHLQHHHSGTLRRDNLLLCATGSAAQASEDEDSETVAVADEDDNEQHPALQVDDDDDEQGAPFPTQQWSLPEPTNVQVRSAQYISSCVSVTDCPPPRMPEVAVIGRSNVGKSSLINLLTGNRKLAHVSKEPGKTRCINHFLINDAWYLVDLPGYGFAKTGFSTREAFDRFTKEYFTNRRNLVVVYLLVDASIPPQKVDLEYASWLRENNIPFAVVFTKADKRKRWEPGQRENVGAFKAALLSEAGFTQVPPSVLTSSALGLGRGPLLRLTASLRQQFISEGLLEAAITTWTREQRLKEAEAAAARAARAAGIPAPQSSSSRGSGGAGSSNGKQGSGAGGAATAGKGKGSAGGQAAGTFVASAALKARLARTTTVVGMQPVEQSSHSQPQPAQHVDGGPHSSGGVGVSQAPVESRPSGDDQMQQAQPHVQPLGKSEFVDSVQVQAEGTAAQQPLQQQQQQQQQQRSQSSAGGKKAGKASSQAGRRKR